MPNMNRHYIFCSNLNCPCSENSVKLEKNCLYLPWKRLKLTCIPVSCQRPVLQRPVRRRASRLRMQYVCQEWHRASVWKRAGLRRWMSRFWVRGSHHTLTFLVWWFRPDKMDQGFDITSCQSPATNIVLQKSLTACE